MLGKGTCFKLAGDRCSRRRDEDGSESDPLSCDCTLLRFQSWTIVSRSLVSSQLSVYCHTRFRGVVPVGKSSLLPWSTSEFVISRIDAKCSEVDF